jgi:hypothetical protein
VLVQLPYLDNPQLGYLLQPAAAAQFDIKNIGEISGDVQNSMTQREVDEKCCKMLTREERQ